MPITNLHCLMCTVMRSCGQKSASCYCPTPLDSPAGSPSSCVPVRPQPNSRHQLPLFCACGKTLQPPQCIPEARAPAAACGSGSVSCNCLTSLGSLAAVSCSCAPEHLRPDSRHWPPLPYVPYVCPWQVAHTDNQGAHSCFGGQVQRYFLHWPTPLGSPVASSSSYAPAHPQPDYFVCLHCHACAHGETLQPQECMLIARAPKLLVGLAQTPVSSH